MSSVSWLRPGGGRLAVGNQAFEWMKRCRQCDPGSVESGGILLGRILTGGKDVVIDYVTGPSPSDYRSRSRFTRQVEPTQTIIRRVWEHSQGTCIYLGEWHTHPSELAQPSNFDLHSWAKHVHLSQFSRDFLLFSIISVEELCVWELRSSMAAPAKLLPNEASAY